MRSWAAGCARGQARWANEARRAAKTAELRAQTVPQLRALCAEHGLHKAGVKAALVARLCDTLCSAEPGGEAAEDGGVRSLARSVLCVCVLCVLCVVCCVLCVVCVRIYTYL